MLYRAETPGNRVGLSEASSNSPWAHCQLCRAHMSHLLIMVMVMVMVNILTGMVLVVSEGLGAMGGGEWGLKTVLAPTAGLGLSYTSFEGLNT